VSLKINLVRSAAGRVARAAIPPIPHEIAVLMRDVTAAGKLVE
jgi:succinate dehydrogenase / fumarate reductase flavoprotein subunit